MPNPTCPQDCSSALPAWKFSLCAPKVQSSEIQRMFFAKETAEPFTNWLNAAEWIERLDQTATDSDNVIRALDVIGDLPAGSPIVREISRRRRITIGKDRTLPFTIDDVSQENYDAARVLECNARYRWWFETEGGFMYGGNEGFLANIDINLVLARGADSAEELQASLSWRGKFMPDRGISPIFGSDSDTTAITYDTMLTFVGATTDTEVNVTGVVSATNANKKFEFTALAGTVGADTDMTVNITGAPAAIVVTFRAEYVGKPFRYTHSDNVIYLGTFAAGDVTPVAQ